MRLYHYLHEHVIGAENAPTCTWGEGTIPERLIMDKQRGQAHPFSYFVCNVPACKAGRKSMTGPLDMVPYPPDFLTDSQLKNEWYLLTQLVGTFQSSPVRAVLHS